MLLKLCDLHKSYDTDEGRHPVLNGISLDLAAGESLAVTGESGSGKSTLLHLVGLLDAPDQGEIVLNSESVSRLSDAERAACRRTHIGFVFQQFNLVPSLTVADNLALQARLAKAHDPKWLSDLAERLGLSAFLKRYPEQLSGGQQQRVAVGRALAARPSLILADEPTGNLDEDTSRDVLDLLLQLCTDSGAALMMATHSISAAQRLSRQVHLTAGRLA